MTRIWIDEMKFGTDAMKIGIDAANIGTDPLRIGSGAMKFCIDVKRLGSDCEFAAMVLAPKHNFSCADGVLRL